MIRHGAARCNPRSGEELRARAVVRRVRGLQLAAAAIPADQFCRGENSSLVSLFLFPRSPNTRTHTRELSLASTIATSSVANFKHSAQLLDPRAQSLPIDRCSCYEDLNEMSDTGRCDLFILLSPLSLSISVLCFPCTLSISAVDPWRARYRRSRTVVFITRENNVRGIDNCREELPRSTTTSWMDERPTARGIVVWIPDTAMNLEMRELRESRNFRSF